ncbi:MAG TPA: protein-methionine-sulfoxide reductase catalytic subunit MsrP [Opitutaceae bacterium]|nr:protein-methionine-sulfoxide reductase catalytic subunit MsrP [Opitutaceae bacterium]
MHIRSPKDWQLPENAATPEHDYRLRPRTEDSPRRDFLKRLALGAAGAALVPPSLRAATFGFPDHANPEYHDPALKPTAYELITSYNNFYEFGTGKADPKPNANDGWKTEPWTVEIGGLCRNPMKLEVNDLIRKIGGIEQRVYRFRCVEAWSMVIPWDGFPLAKLVTLADPTADAKFIQFTTVFDPNDIPGQRSDILDWPYLEGLRMDEARNELAFIATGIYGRAIPNQNGAPLRLVTPWKYGFKGAKSLVKIEFVSRQPRNTWYVMAPDEYGFYANVNPHVDHPRWSQASERVIGAGGFFGSHQPTLMFNGYEKQVAAMYKGMDLRKYF